MVAVLLLLQINQEEWVDIVEYMCDFARQCESASEDGRERGARVEVRKSASGHAWENSSARAMMATGRGRGLGERE
eukprot:803783-Pleurochrysis_carterae.AAC.1